MPRQPDIGFIPTPPHVIEVLLQLAELTPADVVYDLGCGDGRILIAAAKQYGVRGVGIDIDVDRVHAARQQAMLAGVDHLVQFRHADLYDSDFREATVVILYLLPHLNLKLLPALRSQLQPGNRILSHDFDLGDWQPDAVVRVPTEADEIATVYRWIV
jgi:cyclopropane fatty-acyl-phospholipid synthase-like methyltransferase